MLKIKDSVDLKEFEKLNFEYEENIENNRPYYKYNDIMIWCHSKIIELNGLFGQLNDIKINSLYDLIQAGLVEKVVEE